MCRDENTLKNIWFNLYENELDVKLADVDDRIIRPFMLIERTLLAFKDLGFNYIDSLDKIKVIKTELEEASKELKIIREKLNETQKPCENCDVLAKDLSLAKKRANEAEFRVTQIAKILVVPSSDKVEETVKTPCKSPKRKRPCLRDKNENAETIFNSQEVEIGFSLSPGKNKKATPEKTTNSSQLAKSKSPKNGPAKSKRLSRSADLECTPIKKLSPRRNLSADFDQDPSNFSPKRFFPISKDGRTGSDEHEESGFDDSCGPELDKIWLNDDLVSGNLKNKENRVIDFTMQETVVDIVVGGKSSKNREKCVEISPRSRKPKKFNRSLRTDKMIKNSDNSYNLLLERKLPKKRLKQLTLQIQSSNKHKNEAESDVEDIVLPSPEKLLEEEEGNLMDDIFESNFTPVVTSTQKPAVCQVVDKKSSSPIKASVNKPSTSNKQFDNSFDVILDRRKTTPSPNYKYKEKTVRGKARAQLQGWDCEECKKFYELACKNQSPSKLTAKMNFCSRHRSKYKQARPRTPPGFWDLDIPDTPE